MFDASDNGRPPSRPITAALSAILRASDGVLDLLPVATFITDARGTILQYNQRALEIWGRAPRPGQTHEEFNASTRYRTLEGQLIERSLVAEVLATGNAIRDAERIVERPDGASVMVSVNIDPLRNSRGELVGVVNCFFDITERKRLDYALEQSRQHALEQEQRLAATYEHAAIGISEIAPDGHFLRVNEAICSITGYSRDELLAGLIFRFTHPDDSDIDRAAFAEQVAGKLEFYSVEKRFVRKGGRIIWIAVRSSPVRSASGKLLYVVRVVQDITERKAAEERQKLLIDELNHRVKNTLATVQSLAAQTARGGPTPGEFRERFEGRLIALSKAHNQLTEHHWESAELRALLSASFAPYLGTVPDRAVLRGENIMLRPRAVLTLAMAVHELVTNAAKYGALSTSAGHIEVSWHVAEENGRQVLRIDWREQDGPPVAAPRKRGFGSKLIEGSIASELGGTARMNFAPGGLCCDIAIPFEAATVKHD
jgi:PAS domain S-box-containing protein